MPWAKGQNFHNLTLLHFCGAGAYGEVYLCKDLSDRILALKIISKSRLGGEWRRELKGIISYGRIPGEHLLKIYLVDEDQDSFYYTMEAADNICLNPDEYSPDTLSARLKKGKLDTGSLFSLAENLLCGLKEIHDMEMTHRDIKPANIIFVGGIPKISDIGFVCSAETKLTHLVGTLDFLPPEMKKNPSSNAGSGKSRMKSDTYALGMVLYCAMTGNEPESFPSLPDDLPPSPAVKELNRLICRACSTDPFKRICDVDEFLILLKNAREKSANPSFLKGGIITLFEEISLSTTSMFYRLREFGLRHPVCSLLFFVFLLLLVFVVGYRFASPDAKTLPRETETMPRSVAIQAPVSRIWGASSSRSSLSRRGEREGRLKFMDEIMELKRNAYKMSSSHSFGEKLAEFQFSEEWSSTKRLGSKSADAKTGIIFQTQELRRNETIVLSLKKDAFCEIRALHSPLSYPWDSDSAWRTAIVSDPRNNVESEKQVLLYRWKSESGLDTVYCRISGRIDSTHTGLVFVKMADAVIRLRFRSFGETSLFSEKMYLPVSKSVKK